MSKVIRLYGEGDRDTIKILDEYLRIQSEKELEEWKRKYPYLVKRGKSYVE